MRDLMPSRRQRKLRNRRWIIAGTARFGHKNPYVAVPFLARIVRCMDLFRLYLGVRSERRDLGTHAGMHVELPSVIATFEVLTLNPSAGERNSAMRADVFHGESASVCVASKHQRMS